MNTVQLPKQAVNKEPSGSPGKTLSEELPSGTGQQIHECGLELGKWLGGLVSYVSPSSRIPLRNRTAAQDHFKEFRLVRTVTMRCSRRTLELIGLLRSKDPKEVASATELIELSELLKEFIILGEPRTRETSMDTAAWLVWKDSLYSRLTSCVAVRKMIGCYESAAAAELPEKVQELLASRRLPVAWDADLRSVIPRIAVIMSYLRSVRAMQERDEPLKTSILLFSRVDELMLEMMAFINNRLKRFPDDTDALFGSLDAAAYTASIELRKVNSNELKGLVDIRPTPLVFAKVETAYSLLNDSLQMTLVNFVQLVGGDVEPTEVFPNLLTKEQQSLQLRNNMWHLLQLVQRTEQDPDSCPPDSLRKDLIDFRDKNLYFLFYKDMETVERFIEEVIITADKKDLVPLLHRFGAYLETLLRQVNMRVVLANHPFEHLSDLRQDSFG